MMLSERSQRLQRQIADVQERAASVGMLQALKTAGEKFEESRQDLARLRDVERALKARAVAVAEPGHLRTTALVAVRGYRGSLNSSAAAEPQVITPLLNQLRAAANEARSRLTSAWAEYVRSQAPSLNTTVLAVLRGIPSLRAPATNLERCLRTIEGWRNSLPNDGNAVAAFDADVAEAKRMWQQLGGDDLGPDVTQFLQAAATSSATIESLTPEITEWLKRHKVWNAFRITLVSDAAGPRP